MHDCKKKKKHNFYSFPWNGTQKKDNKIHRMTSARETISGGVNEKENGDWKISLHVQAQLLGLCQSRGYKKQNPHINISGRTGTDLWEVMRIAWVG